LHACRSTLEDPLLHIR